MVLMALHEQGKLVAEDLFSSCVEKIGSSQHKLKMKKKSLTFTDRQKRLQQSAWSFFVVVLL